MSISQISRIFFNQRISYPTHSWNIFAAKPDFLKHSIYQSIRLFQLDYGIFWTATIYFVSDSATDFVVVRCRFCVWNNFSFIICIVWIYLGFGRYFVIVKIPLNQHIGKRYNFNASSFPNIDPEGSEFLLNFGSPKIEWYQWLVFVLVLLLLTVYRNKVLTFFFLFLSHLDSNVKL